MMRKLAERGETIAREAQRRRVERLAARLRDLLGGVSIDAEDARVLVSGRGLLKRWLGDSRLRFLGGDRG